LDEPCAEGHDGEKNGERLFECPNGHGLFTRNTQIKPLAEGGASPAKKPIIPSLSEGIKSITEASNAENGLMGDSPLVSPTVGGKAPKDTPNSMAASQANLLQKMESAVEEKKTEVKPKAASGWKEKLEKIKA
jgi:hypothetical protein